MLLRATIIVIAIIITSPQQCVAKDISYQALRKYVFNTVKNNTVPINEPKFDWSRQYMEYEIIPSIKINFQDDPLNYPFSALVTLASIQKYRFVSNQARTFWKTKVFPKVEREIKGMVQDINAGKLKGDKLDAELETALFRIYEIYQSELDALAKRQGKQGARARNKEPYLPTITVRPNPTTATVKYMSAGAFHRHKFIQSQEPQSNDSKWVTAPANGTFKVSQVVKILVIWNDGRKQSGLIHALQSGPTKILQVSPTNGFAWKK